MLEQFSPPNKIKLVSSQFVPSNDLQPPAGLPAFNFCDGPAFLNSSRDAADGACARSNDQGLPLQKPVNHKRDSGQDCVTHQRIAQ